jgi:predicted enzyme related to lactoylglutathione lyase
VSENNLRIDYIEFGTDDVERARAFYAEAFGWKFTDYGPDYTAFEDGRLEGGIHQKGEPGLAPLVVIYADDLESAQAKIVEVGGEIIKDIFSFPGGKRFHFRDPSGNELAVWSDK